MTAIASLFGMNLKHGLDERSVPMFLLVLGIGVVLGFAVKGWVVGSDKMRPPPDKKPS
jgi:Mg2+ and Co2+ transporter CorA